MIVTEWDAARVDEAAAFAWDAYQQPGLSCFPRRENAKILRETLRKATQHADDRLLVCHRNGVLTGVMNLFVEPKERFLQSGGLYIHDEAAYAEVIHAFIAYIRNLYPGFTMFLGFPKDNASAAQCMAEAGFPLVESSVTLRLTKENFTPNKTDLWVYPVTPEKFDAYAAFHDVHNPDIYWNSQRIRESPDRWRLYAAETSGIIMGGIAVMVYNATDAEVFALNVGEAYDATVITTVLLSESMADLLSGSIRRVLYFEDEDKPEVIRAAQQIGFMPEDYYRGYRRNL